MEDYNYYFKLDGLDKISNSIAYKLLENENLMKLLMYSTSDALELPPVTDIEPSILAKIIDQIDITETRIFFKPRTNATQKEARAELRFFIFRSKPDNFVLSKTMWCFQIVCHDDLWMLTNGRIRPYKIIQELLKSLNGKDVEGMGVLDFSIYPMDYKRYTDSHSGYELIGCTRVG